jgi:hypothetical protein
MQIILNIKTAQKIKLEYGSLEAYADRFRKLGFNTVHIEQM